VTPGPSRRRGQELLQRLQTAVYNLIDFLGGARFHRVRQHQHAQLGHAAGAGRNAREVGKHLGHHDNRWDAGALALDRVVDTPRRTRPSGTESNDGGIDRAHEAGHLATFFLGGTDTHARVEADHVAHRPALLRRPV
jgi:hypothetical protein